MQHQRSLNTNYGDQEFVINGYSPYINSTFLTQPISSNSTSEINSINMQRLSMQQPFPIGYNLHNVVLNDQISSANSLGPFFPENRLIPVDLNTGQQMIFTNVYSFNNTPKPQLTQPAFINPLNGYYMTPLVSSTPLLNPIICNNNTLPNNSTLGVQLNSSLTNQINNSISDTQLTNQNEDIIDNELEEENLSSEQDFNQNLNEDIQMVDEQIYKNEIEDNHSVESSDDDSDDEQESEKNYCENNTNKNKSSYLEDSFSSSESSENNFPETTIHENLPTCSKYAEMNDKIPTLCNIKKEKLDTEESSVKLNEQGTIEELRNFAKSFKKFRVNKEMTQDQVCKELMKLGKRNFSQSKICRFEKLGKIKLDRTEKEDLDKLFGITAKTAFRTKELLETYMHKVRAGTLDTIDLSSENKTRKKRTNFTPEAAKILNEFFQKNKHASTEEITELSSKTNYSEKEIKVWFNNKRQSLKKMESSINK